MTSLKDYVRDVLLDLSKSQPKLTLAKFRDNLRAFLQAQSVEISGAAGKTHLQRALEQELRITINVDYKPDNGTSDRVTEPEDDFISPESGPPEPISSPAGSERTPVTQEDPRFVRFIRELDKLERARRFVWIGYLAKEKLPELGFSADEVNQVLDGSAADGIITLGKVPNPKNPEFPATRVRLNREHPAVKRALQNGRPKGFEPIKLPGGPLSDDIIRDRR